VPLRIAWDLDGVLADMETGLLHQAEALFGDKIKRRRSEAAEASPDPASPREGAGEAAAEAPPPVLTLDLTPRQLQRLWRHVETVEGFWESLKEIEPGAVERLGKIAADRRWEVIFLTRRPESAGATAQVQSQRWLEANGFRLPSVYVVQGSRGRIAAALALDIVVDDRPQNCFDVCADSHARAILVCRDEDPIAATAAKRLGIGVVKSVNDCLDILAKMDAAAPGGGGIVDRVMRRLGLKDAASL